MTTTTSAIATILKTDTKGRVRTPMAEREALLELFEQGGLSAAAFARQHGLRYSTFAHWIKVKRERVARPQTAHPLFQEVQLDVKRSSDASGLLLELPLGVRVRLERVDQIPLVVLLGRHLREQAPHAGGV